MARLFKKNCFNLTTSFFDHYDRLRPHGILDLFQEMAGRHASELHIGYQPLYDKGIIWILARNKYIVIDHPKMSEEVIVETWPLPAQRFDFTREYKITSADGKTLIIGSSLWVLYDYIKKRIIPADMISFEGEFIDQRNYDEKFLKIPTFPVDECQFIRQYKVSASLLDHNGHMNNARYAEIFLDVANLSSAEVLHEFQADYISQSYLDDMIDVYMKRISNDFYVYGYISSKLCFQIRGAIKE